MNQSEQLANDRFLRALHLQDVDRTPVWVMRQAGRYLPEYRKLRLRANSFLNLCKTPELACEATMQPIARFDLDAAIIFSDILTIPDAMGLGLSFVEGEGPKFAHPLQHEAAITKLTDLEPEQDLAYVMDAITLVKQSLANSIPLIGFAGSPWTLATYIVEGGSSKTFSIIKGMLYKNPQVLHALLQYLSRQVAKYLVAQLQAGVNAVMIFDTWGGVLQEKLYLEFSLNYMQQIVEYVKSVSNTPIILFTKNGGQALPAIAATGCTAIGLDWTADLKKARRMVGSEVALQGNLDPCVLYGTPARIEQEVQFVLEQYGSGPGHIFNLGHGIQPGVVPENLQVMLNAVKKFSPLFHKTKLTV